MKKLILDEGIHKNSSTNWNFAVERSKRTHKKVDRTKLAIEKTRATFLINFTLVSRVKRIIIAPIKGSKIILSKIEELNIFKSFY